MHTVFLSLGSNLGDKSAMLGAAIKEINLQEKIVSSIYKTEPWKFKKPVPWFLNCVLKGKTDADPFSFFEHLQEIEKKLGRGPTSADSADSNLTAATHYGSIKLADPADYESRTIDIDIIYYGDLVLNSPKLTIPHPQIAHRKFILLPLVELVPTLIHPVLNKNSLQLLKECKDTSIVEKL